MTAAASIACDPLPAQCHGHRWTLPGTPAAVEVARLLTRQTLGAWQLSDLIQAAELVTSELVTNGIRHTGCQYIGLSVLHRIRGPVRVEIRDSSRGLPCRLSPEPMADRGRGLLLVHAEALSWGVDLAPLGKIVWAEFAVPRTAGAAACRSCSEPHPSSEPPVLPTHHQLRAVPGTLTTKGTR
ncbi:ATP-binding protein [Kitasatospora sp. NPDC057965]|uniref:ATP-binding protein n=1 Tax=Kitasatospora sp. NPDC057965 TaxID=3346291 RepID=UPI0036D7C40D